MQFKRTVEAGAKRAAAGEGEDLVEMDDRAYCLKCARRLAG